MKILNQQELKFFEQFFSLNQKQLLKAMKHYLGGKYKNIIDTEDYLVAVGDIPIALTAHLDTVFTTPPKNIYYDRTKNIIWSPEGLGADDRAGVYAIIQIIKSGLRPTIIFTTGEEDGCIGANKLVTEAPDAPTELKYIIELDRRGNDDCVFYSCNNSLFDEYVESFGFVTKFGSFSDISAICPIWGVAGVNLSIGYENEHSVSETLHIGHMFNTIKKVKRMLEDANNITKFDYIEDLTYSRWFSSVKSVDEQCGWSPLYGISKENWVSFIEPKNKCNDCNNWDFDYNLFPTKLEDGNKIQLCADCLTKRTDLYWCNKCGEPFINSKEKIYCKDCRGSNNGSANSTH